MIVAAGQHEMPVMAGAKLLLLVLRELAVKVESEYVKPQGIASINCKIAIINCATKYVTMIIQMVEILSPAFECARSIAAKLTTIRSGPMNRMIVLIVV